MTNVRTKTNEHTELYKKLVHNLTETVPTNNKEFESAHCRNLGKAYSSDLIARRKALENEATNKEFDYADIVQLSYDILDRLDKDILPNATEPVSIVFYNTMKGDYCRHIAKYLTDHDKRKHKVYCDAALKAFLDGKEAATSGLSCSDPFYLELHISLAKFYYFMREYRTARITNITAHNASREAIDSLYEGVVRSQRISLNVCEN
ncbi:14-3-3 protein [Mortierella sp. AD094]|nr:14-3-3 protein [Mortierella sp. AD094]